ncbi:MAG: outer membrane beta-barrel protein [Melioribacteraceae bacterium]
MKKLIIIIFVFSSIIYPQELQEGKSFSKFNMGILGGINFNTIPTVGSTFQFEGTTNLTSNLNLKIAIAYSNMFKESDYQIKSYNHFKIDNVEGYQEKTYKINRIQYSSIPINLGLEYTFDGEKILPYGLVEAGYNFFSIEEQIAAVGSGRYYNTEGEVPSEFRNKGPFTQDDSAFLFGIGAGVKYKISSSLALNIRYIYRYNDSIINTNQFLVGLNF